MSSIGIIMLAVGSTKYGNLAYACAKSIHKHSYIPITLVTDFKATLELTAEELKIFSNIKEINKKHIETEGKQDYIKAKLYINTYAEYERNLFIDADSLLIKPIQPLLDELNGRSFVPMVHGINTFEPYKMGSPFGIWGDIKVVKKFYNIQSNTIPSISSTFMYFERNQVANDIFVLAQMYYELGNAPTIKWRGGYADEFFYNVVLSIKDIKLEKFYPVYSYLFSKEQKISDIKNNFYFITSGGDSLSEFMVKLYNTELRELCLNTEARFLISSGKQKY